MICKYSLLDVNISYITFIYRTFYNNDANTTLDQEPIPVFRNKRIIQNDEAARKFKNQAKVLLANPITKKILFDKKTIPKPKQQVLRVQSISGNGR